MGDLMGAAMFAAFVVGAPILGVLWLRRLRSPGESWRVFLTHPSARPLHTALAVSLVVCPPTFFVAMLAVASDRSLWLLPLSLVAVFAVIGGIVLAARPAR